MGYWSASHVPGALLIYAELFCRMALSICPDGLGSTLLQRPPNLPGCATGHALLRRLELIAQQFTTRLAPITPAEGWRRGHAKTTARGISVRRIVRFCPVSTAPDPAYRALGRGRRHRRDGAHHRKPA